MPTQLERNLQQEIGWRLARYPVIWLPVPNGLFIPSHNEQERHVVGRIVNRMKSDGMLVPGAPDGVIAGEKGALMVELKRPASRDLLGRRPRGRLSPEQRAFQQRCVAAGVEYIVASDWEDIRCRISELY